MAWVPLLDIEGDDVGIDAEDVVAVTTCPPALAGGAAAAYVHTNGGGRLVVAGGGAATALALNAQGAALVTFPTLDGSDFVYLTPAGSCAVTVVPPALLPAGVTDGSYVYTMGGEYFAVQGDVATTVAALEPGASGTGRANIESLWGFLSPSIDPAFYLAASPAIGRGAGTFNNVMSIGAVYQRRDVPDAADRTIVGNFEAGGLSGWRVLDAGIAFVNPTISVEVVGDDGAGPVVHRCDATLPAAVCELGTWMYIQVSIAFSMGAGGSVGIQVVVNGQFVGTYFSGAFGTFVPRTNPGVFGVMGDDSGADATPHWGALAGVGWREANVSGGTLSAEGALLSWGAYRVAGDVPVLAFANFPASVYTLRYSVKEGEPTGAPASTWENSGPTANADLLYGGTVNLTLMDDLTPEDRV